MRQVLRAGNDTANIVNKNSQLAGQVFDFVDYISVGVLMSRSICDYDIDCSLWIAFREFLLDSRQFVGISVRVLVYMP